MLSSTDPDGRQGGKRRYYTRGGDGRRIRTCKPEYVMSRGEVCARAREAKFSKENQRLTSDVLPGAIDAVNDVLVLSRSEKMMNLERETKYAARASGFQIWWVADWKSWGGGGSKVREKGGPGRRRTEGSGTGALAGGGRAEGEAGRPPG